jgi:hypothetical protein
VPCCKISPAPSRSRAPLPGLVWDGARPVAAATAYDACTDDDTVGSLRIRADSMRAGYWDRQCANPDGIAQSLDVAAAVLKVM